MKIKPQIINEHYIGKGLATLGAALICGYWAYLNNGKSGIGWFIVCMVLIW